MKFTFAGVFTNHSPWVVPTVSDPDAINTYVATGEFKNGVYVAPKTLIGGCVYYVGTEDYGPGFVTKTASSLTGAFPSVTTCGRVMGVSNSDTGTGTNDLSATIGDYEVFRVADFEWDGTPLTLDNQITDPDRPFSGGTVTIECHDGPASYPKTPYVGGCEAVADYYNLVACNDDEEDAIGNLYISYDNRAATPALFAVEVDGIRYRIGQGVAEGDLPEDAVFVDALTYSDCSAGSACLIDGNDATGEYRTHNQPASSEIGCARIWFDADANVCRWQVYRGPYLGSGIVTAGATPGTISIAAHDSDYTASGGIIQTIDFSYGWDPSFPERPYWARGPACNGSCLSCNLAGTFSVSSSAPYPSGTTITIGAYDEASNSYAFTVDGYDTGTIYCDPETGTYTATYDGAGYSTTVEVDAGCNSVGFPDDGGYVWAR